MIFEAGCSKLNSIITSRVESRSMSLRVTIAMPLTVPLALPDLMLFTLHHRFCLVRAVQWGSLPSQLNGSEIYLHGVCLWTQPCPLAAPRMSRGITSSPTVQTSAALYATPLWREWYHSSLVLNTISTTITLLLTLISPLQSVALYVLYWKPSVLLLVPSRLFVRRE